MPDWPGNVVRDAHYPGRAAIQSYGNGGFRFGGMSHRGSLLCLPSGIYGWKSAPTEAIDELSLAAVFAEAAEIDILLVGTGSSPIPLGREVCARCRDLHVIADAMTTGAAVRTYNVLLAEDRAVAAALIAVD